VNLFQFATYVFIDLIPVFTIVSTHHKNWKECVHERQESFVELDESQGSIEDSEIMPIEEVNTSDLEEEVQNYGLLSQSVHMGSYRKAAPEIN
jgi:hypothetical protein